MNNKGHYEIHILTLLCILHNKLLIYKTNMVVLFCLIQYILFKKGDNLTKISIMHFLPVSDSQTRTK